MLAIERFKLKYVSVSKDINKKEVRDNNRILFNTDVSYFLVSVKN
jgi:hypothetical protein